MPLFYQCFFFANCRRSHHGTCGIMPFLLSIAFYSAFAFGMKKAKLTLPLSLSILCPLWWLVVLLLFSNTRNQINRRLYFFSCFFFLLNANLYNRLVYVFYRPIIVSKLSQVLHLYGSSLLNYSVKKALGRQVYEVQNGRKWVENTSETMIKKPLTKTNKSK